MTSTILDLIRQIDPRCLVTGDEINLPIHENVLSQFPTGTKLIFAKQHGKSDWTMTVKITVRLPDSSQTTDYLLKLAAYEAGILVIEGEFASMKELHKTMPDLVPKPYACSKFDAGNITIYFLIEEFIHLNNRPPKPNQFCSKLAQLHRNSVSPTGKFGFGITTCNGNMPQATDSWESSWTTCFTKLLRHAIELDVKANGPWKELDILGKQILEKVVPRLIGAVEKDGRSVKPCLIHGKVLYIITPPDSSSNRSPSSSKSAMML